MKQTCIWMTLLALGALGCPSSSPGDDDDATEPPPTEGTLAISFRIDDDWLESMDEPPVGAFYGTIFWADEVTGVGPDDDAEVLESFDVAQVDLTGDGHASGVLHTSVEIEADWVTILGFLDTDANSTEEDRSPDDNDPVTLPNDNEFEVIAGEETAAEVLFDFLNP